MMLSSATAGGEQDAALTADAALVAGTLRGKPRAYEALVRRYERSARAACFAVLKDWHAAQDAAQEAFITAYSKLRGLRDPASFGTWLITVAHHRAVRVARNRHTHEQLDRLPPPVAAAPAASGAEDLLDLVGKLPAHERAVVLLRYVEGHDVAAIARLCGRPVGTVTKQLSRAHKRLHKLLTEEER
jgi:RNA polymerase sigma-70 factor (ECF subfamily)